MSDVRFKERKALGTINPWQTESAMNKDSGRVWFPRARASTGIRVEECDILPPHNTTANPLWHRSFPRDGLAERGVMIASVNGKRKLKLNGPGIQIPREDIPEVIEELKKHL